MRNYFPLLLGNGDTKMRLGSAILSRSMPHAFLIGGPSGSGKNTLAVEIAAALNCANTDSEGYSLPCGVCSSCKRIYEGNFPDIKFLSRKKERATIGVDAIKTFREDMFLSSTESECKIYIIKDAHTMTPEAQNALLKVLEEPPRRVYIILLAEECDKILTTIKSRVQYIPMARFDDVELTKYLVEKSELAAKLQFEDKEKFIGAVISADGRLGRAIELVRGKAAEENNLARREVYEFIAALGQRSGYENILAAVGSLPKARGELLISLERIITALRDLIAVKTGGGAKMLFFSSAEEAIHACADTNTKKLLAVYDAVNEAHELTYRNANINNLIANLASKIKHS